eukprot:9191328-Pyramimonas_sp.AAC.1
MDPGPERGLVWHVVQRDHPQDGLYTNDPWRSQAQPMPVLAGQPASFAPMSRATTPFGTPQSAGSTNSQQAMLQGIRMDPQLCQALQATSPFASPRPTAGQPATSDHEAAQRAESCRSAAVDARADARGHAGYASGRH